MVFWARIGKIGISDQISNSGVKAKIDRKNPKKVEDEIRNRY
jgi:hypothetical protein